MKTKDSFQSRLIKLLLRFGGRKRFWESSGEVLKKRIAKNQLYIAEPSTNFQQKVHIEKKERDGHFYYELRPRKVGITKHIMYLHGGGFVSPITKHHWRFLERLMNEVDFNITVPLYPLSPKYNYKNVFEFLYPLYFEIMNENPSEIILMGDSAGGNLALALPQLIKENQSPRVSKIVLISPLLDMSFENPEIDEVEPKDPFLARTAIYEIVKRYAGDTDLKNYLLSPMYGDLKDLGEISIFMGSDDILAPDARKLSKMTNENGLDIRYFEYPKMFHVFPILDFPEGKDAFKKIVRTLKGEDF